MPLLLKVLSKCYTCCQSWIEPGVVRNNREMAFRSIIKLCYKCHPSTGMEFMHTYYYPGNSKGGADPLAWKLYNFFFFLLFSAPHSEPSHSKTQMRTIIYESVSFSLLLKCFALCPLTFSKVRRNKAGVVSLRTLNMTCSLMVCAKALHFWMPLWLGCVAMANGTLAQYPIALTVSLQRVILPYKSRRLLLEQTASHNFSHRR